MDMKCTIINKREKDNFDNKIPKLCFREINKPKNFVKGDHFKNYYKESDLYSKIDKNNHILEKMFLIYELHDDFDTSNIDVLLDILSYEQLSIIILESVIFNIDIGTSYFFAENNNDDILYIIKNDLIEQIQMGQINIDNHKYYDLINNIINDDIISNKILIIPICMNIMMNELPLKYTGSTLSYKYKKSNKTIKQFVKNILISSQTIDFCLENDYYDHNNVRYYKNMYPIEKYGFFMNGELLSLSNTIKYIDYIQSKLQYSFIITDMDASKYFTIKISPDYELIYKNLWNSIVIPNITSICYTTNGIDKKYNINEIAQIKKSKNCHMYVFSKNPDISIKNWMKNIGNLELIHKEYYTDFKICRIISNSINTKLKLHPYYKLNITFNLEYDIIPIKITINIYSRQCITYGLGIMDFDTSLTEAYNTTIEHNE
jgi:hypothetical protein